MRFLLLFLIPILMMGCTKKEDGFKIYTIGEGKHSSSRGINMLTSDNLTFKAKFGESAEYYNEDPVNQFDINKLYGFSDCNGHHQKNSARFGWRWLNDAIEIHAYVYNEGVRASEYITNVDIGEIHDYEIRVELDKYIFQVDSEIMEMPRTNKCEVGFYYKLYPYFGGDETAPHDISILIKEENTGR